MIWLIGGIIVFIIVAVVLFFLLKAFLKVFLILVGIIIIAVLVGGFFIYSDARDIQENFEISENLFLFRSDEKIIAGMQTIPGQEQEFLDSDKIAIHNDQFQEDNLDDIKGLAHGRCNSVYSSISGDTFICILFSFVLSG